MIALKLFDIYYHKQYSDNYSH